MSDDRFALEEGGGGLDGFTGTIAEFYFQDGEYGLSAMVKSAFDDPENYPQFEDGSFTQFYSCGKGWTTPDMGETAQHADGPQKRFNKSSKFGQFIEAIAKIPGISEALPADWTMTKASSYKGMHLVWGRVPLEVRKQVDGEWKTVTEQRLMPIALADTQLSMPSSNGAAAVDVDSLGLTSEQVNALSLAAQGAASGAKFIEAVVAYDASLMAGTPLAAAITKDADGVRKALAEATF